MTIESEILNHLNTEWDQSPTISFANSNVVVKYDATTEYLVPRIRLVLSDVKEIPFEDGIVRRDYIFIMNLLLKENTGMANANTYTARLSAIFHKKDVQTANFLYHFGALDVADGFPSGAHFEVPVSIDFYTFSS